MINQTNIKSAILHELYGRVGEVLFYEWDPIGVNGMPSCRDEYDNYVPIIASYLEDYFDSNALRDLMLHIVTETMGLNAETGSARMRSIGKTIGILWAWKRHLATKHAKPLALHQINETGPREADFVTKLAVPLCSIQAELHCFPQAAPFQLPLDDQLQLSKYRRREMVLIPDKSNILGVRVGEVLCYQWNPLKIPRHPICRDVYSIYLPEILAALESCPTQVILEAVLEEALLDFPRDQSAKRPAKRTAELIMEWKKLLS